MLDPEPLISDGVVLKQTLKRLNKSEEWLKDELLNKDIKDIKDVFVCLALKNDLFVVKK